MPDFSKVAVGDTVTRMLGGVVPMELPVTDVTETEIILGPFGWTFDRKTGLEVDDEISCLVSHLVLPNN